MKQFDILATDVGASSVKFARFRVCPGGSTAPGLVGEVVTARQPPWATFERWVADKGLHHGVAFLAVSCAGFVDSTRGEVRLFRAAEWARKNLVATLGTTLGVPVRILINDAEAHVLAHMHPGQVYPLLGVALGTSPGVAYATAPWTLFRPRPDSNLDLGEMRFPSRSTNDRVWWNLGSPGFEELCSGLGPDEGARHYGYRLGALLATLASVFQPRVVVFSGGLAERHYHAFSPNLESEFSAQKPDWVERPRFELSPFGRAAALWGLAAAASAGWG